MNKEKQKVQSYIDQEMEDYIVKRIKLKSHLMQIETELSDIRSRAIQKTRNSKIKMVN